MAMKEKKATSQGRKGILKAQKYRNPEKVTGMKNYPRLQKQLATQLKTAQSQADKGDMNAIKKVKKLKGELSGLSLMRQDAAAGRRGSVSVATGAYKGPMVGPNADSVKGKGGKGKSKFYGKNVPTTSIGIGTVKAPKKKDADVALGMALTVLPFGSAAKGVMLAKGAIQANRALKATPQIKKAITFINRNAAPAARARVDKAIASQQKAVWNKVAKGQLTKAQAKAQSNAIYKAEMGKLWQATAKKVGKLK